MTKLEKSIDLRDRYTVQGIYEDAIEAMCGFRGDGLGSIAPQLDAKRNGYMCIFLMGKLDGFRLGSERSRTRRYIDFTTVAFVRWYNRWARTHPFEGW